MKFVKNGVVITLRNPFSSSASRNSVAFLNQRVPFKTHNEPNTTTPKLVVLALQFFQTEQRYYPCDDCFSLPKEWPPFLRDYSQKCCLLKAH